MSIVDWIIVCIPFILVGCIAFYTRRFLRGVADFLAAGRVAGRYVVAVASGEAALGLISVVALFELYYKSGFAVGFWYALATPIMLVVTLTGFAIYRFRETRALTMGQFFEIRYSKRFRVFASMLQAASGILNYGLFPAVGARFLVYYLDLPIHFEFLGMQWPTFAVVMAGFLFVAVLITTLGGQLTLMTSDCVMGIISYPLYLAVVASVFFTMSWSTEIAPTLMSRSEGNSMLNPFDVSNLRDFNLFYVVVGIMGQVYGVMSWSGNQGYAAAARNAHEQKMGKILGVWRAGFSGLMIIILAVAAFTFYNHEQYREHSEETRQHLSWKALEDTAPSYAPDGFTQGTVDGGQLREWEERVQLQAPEIKQVKETIEHQMLVPVALREILPIGILGAFCAIMILLMVSTDCSYLLSWGAIIVQDLVLPLRKRSFTPRQQLFWLRVAVIFVAVYAFFFSLYFGQVTYILMFFALTGSIYMGGAGAVIIGGLYWKKGTSTGAWAAMLTGSILAALGFFFMNFWVGLIYPTLAKAPVILDWLSRGIIKISAPFEPFIMWRITPDEFFINGQEIFFLTMLSSILAFIGVSLLTCRKDFNMDRMLNRGTYSSPDEVSIPNAEKASVPENAGWRKLLLGLSGIDDQFTRGDRILSLSVMAFSCWGFGSWLVIVLWNFASPWPSQWWAHWFFIGTILLGAVIGLVSTVWFTIGGVRDLKKMFLALKTHRNEDDDNGRVGD